MVSSKGGQAVQLTSNSAYDSDPLWSADGKNIVFSSYRELSKDVFVTSVNGGEPRRLTFYSGSETPLAVLRDGTVLFSANYCSDGVYDGFPGAELSTDEVVALVDELVEAHEKAGYPIF